MPPIKSPKRTGLSAQVSGAGGAVSNWAPLSRLKKPFSNSAISINAPPVTGLKNKLGAPFLSSSRQDFTTSNSDINNSNKDFRENTVQGDSVKGDSPDHAPPLPPSVPGSSNQNNHNVSSSLNETIVSKEIEGIGVDSSITADNNIEEDDSDPDSTMQFEGGRPLEEELWFHGVLPRGNYYYLKVCPVLD